MTVYTVTYLNKNYGSFLQAYALQCAIKENNAIPVILQMQLKKTTKEGYLKKGLRFIKPKKNYSFYRRLRLKQQEKKFLAKYRHLDDFKSKYLQVCYIDDTGSFIDRLESNDILLAGSDQIWSMALGPLSKWYTFQWENLKNETKRFSYAASIGLNKLSENQKLEYKEALAKFSVVSFREKQSYELLKDYLDNEVRWDLDPTLLFGGDFWSSIASPRLVKDKYIFIYMLRPDKKLIKIGKILGEKLNCKVVYTGLMADRFSGVETICDAGIEDFLSYIRYAEGVITNSFHGTVFSVLFQKKFVTVKLSDTSIRMQNLLELVGLEKHYIEGVSEIDVFDDTIEYQSVIERLSVERKKSMQYIKRLCSEEQ